MILNDARVLNLTTTGLRDGSERTKGPSLWRMRPKTDFPQSASLPSLGDPFAQAEARNAFGPGNRVGAGAEPSNGYFTA